MKPKDLLWLLAAFAIWRASLFVFSYLGVILFEHQVLFLGGGLEDYLRNPLFWGWGNFDGEHYLSIAQNGYRDLLYFYFPLYPLLIGFISPSKMLMDLHSSALLISNVSFALALIGLYKLLLIDYKRKTIKFVMVLLLIFPTSFYFAASYTESLFLMLIVWSLYFLRSKYNYFGGLLSIFTSAVRIIGIALMPAFLFETYYNVPHKKLSKIFLTLLPLFGFTAYVYFLWDKTGNPFEYNRGSELFGEYRSQSPLLLPQIFYRYIFKIIPNLTWSYFPATFTAILEFLSGLLLTATAIYSFFKIRTSYWLYLIVGFLMPSIYNGFVSMPRYAVVLFPLFISIALFIKDYKYLKFIYISFSIIFLFFATALFVRGYWVS